MIEMTDVITACAGIAVAFFAFVTLWVAQRTRRKQSIEKQLEKLINPIYEIMDWAVREQLSSDKAQHTIHIGSENYRKLVNTFLGYGHYLPMKDHDEIKRILLSPVATGNGMRTYPEWDFKKALYLIKLRREMLMLDLDELGGLPWLGE